MIIMGGVIRPQRGRTICLSTSPDVTAPELRDLAVKQMKYFNKDLDDGPFALLYHDQSEIVNIPGTQTPFTLRKYKEEIGKSYQRITVFICSKRDLEEGKLCSFVLVVFSSNILSSLLMCCVDFNYILTIFTIVFWMINFH